MVLILMGIIVLIGVGLITRWLVVSARADKRVMSPTMKTLTVVFGGMAVMVVTVVAGVSIALALPLDHGNFMAIPIMFFGAVIGLIVGVTIWVWLGYMVCRVKKPAELPPGPPTILHSIDEGNIEAVKQHLAAGTDVNAKDVVGKTPLDEAIFGNHSEIADLLRKHGAKEGH